MIKLYRMNAYVLLMLLLALSFVSKGQINSPAGAIIPFGSNKSYSYGIMPTNLPSSGSYGAATDAGNAYNTWKSDYITACGSQYRVKFDDPTITVSEGIGYGMLLSAYAADKAVFDGLWAYYKANADGNGLLNWKTNGCSGVNSSGAATDADEDAATALLVAATQWPTASSPYNYMTEAQTLISNIKKYDMDYTGTFQALNGDGWGTGANCRNPSYHAPAYYKLYATAVTADATFWGTNAVNAAYTLIQKNANSTTGLVSDWCDESGNTNACQSGSTSGQYGYDACRNPWRMATDVIWNNDSKGVTQCTKIASYVSGQGATNVGGPVSQSGGGGGHYATFVSTFAAGIMGSTNQTLMNQMYSQAVGVSDAYQNSNPSGYFGNTLRCISLFMMTGNFWKPGTSPNQKILVQESGLNYASGSTLNLGNVQQGTNVSYTFTIDNIGQKTLTVSTPTFSGTNSSYFSVTTNPATSVNANSSTTFVVKCAVPSGQTGSFSATLTIPSNDPTTPSYTINLTVTGTTNATAPQISVAYNGVSISNNNSPAYSLGDVTESAKGYYTFTINNTGTAPLTITNITASGTNYAMYGTNPTSIAAGSSGTFAITVLAPASTGNQTGSVTIAASGLPNYVINLTAATVTCSTSITATSILNDYEGNINVTMPNLPTGLWTAPSSNPQVNSVNSTLMCASYTRQSGGTGYTQTYSTIRYKPCGSTFDVATIKGLSFLLYSPQAGIPITLSWKKSDGSSPVNSDYSSDLKATTTKAGTWEKIFFDLTPLNGATTAAYMDIEIDPLLTAMKAAGVTSWQFYLDQIQYELPPCITDLPSSQVFMDYDSHRNLTFLWSTSGSTLNEATANPSATGINTSATVAKFTRATTGSYAGWRYTGCQSKIDLSNKTVISMMVYSPAAGIPIQMALQNSAGASVKSVIVKTTTSGSWEKLYYDFSSIANNTTAVYMDIYPDTGAKFGSTPTYYFDNIQYDIIPCTVPATPTISAGGPITFCSGGSVVLTGNSTTGGVTYQWSNSSGTISGTTNATYAATAAGSYTVTVSTGATCTSTSTATVVTVNSIPATPTISGSPLTFCSGNSVTLSASDATGGVTYQWSKGGTAISGATASTYSATTSGSYTVVATSTASCSSAASTATVVTVNTTPATPSISGSPLTFCSGSSVTLSASDATGGVSYQWSNNGTSITGATNATYTTSASGSYTVKATLSGCSSASTATVVTVNTTPAKPTISGSPTTFCSGGSVTLTASDATGGVTYQWYKGGASISGATASTYSANAAGSYTVVATSASPASCPSAASAATTVTVTPSNNVSVTITGSSATCTGSTVTFTANGTGTGLSYQWLLNGTNAGTNSATYTNSSLADGDKISCVVTSSTACSAGSPATSNTITETVSASGAATVTIASDESSTVCSGTAINFTVTGSTFAGTPSYQWQVNGSNVGTNSSAYSSTALNDGDVVTCIMTSSLSCATGSPATSNQVTANVTAIGTSPCAPPPTLTVNGPTTVTAGQTGIVYYITNPNSGSSYVWDIPAGASITSSGSLGTKDSIVVDFSNVTGTGSQSVSVTETNSHGYSTTSSLAVTVNTNATGIFGTYSASVVTVSPNPFSTTATINIGNGSIATTQLTIKVYDMRGVTVYTSDAYSTNQNINLGATLESGVYVVQAIYNDQIQTLKIVKSEQ